MIRPYCKETKKRSPGMKYDKYASMLIACDSPYMEMPCIERHCNECQRDEGAYRKCPGCGKEVAQHGGMICSCGTWVNLCTSYIVSRYIIPSPVALETMVKDDAI